MFIILRTEPLMRGRPRGLRGQPRTRARGLHLQRLERERSPEAGGAEHACARGHVTRLHREGQEVLSHFPGETIGKQGEHNTQGLQSLCTEHRVWAICELLIFLNRKWSQNDGSLRRKSPSHPSLRVRYRNEYWELSRVRSRDSFSVIIFKFFTVENFKSAQKERD